MTALQIVRSSFLGPRPRLLPPPPPHPPGRGKCLCVFFLLLSYASREPSGNISLWRPPLSTGKLGKLTPPPPGQSDPFRGGGMDIFWNHTIGGHYNKYTSFLQGRSISMIHENDVLVCICDH